MHEYEYNTNTCMKIKTLVLKKYWRDFRGNMCLKTHTWSAYVKYDHKYMPDIKKITIEIRRSNALHNVWEKENQAPNQKRKLTFSSSRYKYAWGDHTCCHWMH
jgi:hypothetical protein